LECCERKILLAGWWLLLKWCERKILLADAGAEQGDMNGQCCTCRRSTGTNEPTATGAGPPRTAAAAKKANAMRDHIWRWVAEESEQTNRYTNDRTMTTPH